jgi:hypothetical protein
MNSNNSREQLIAGLEKLQWPSDLTAYERDIWITHNTGEIIKALSAPPTPCVDSVLDKVIAMVSSRAAMHKASSFAGSRSAAIQRSECGDILRGLEHLKAEESNRKLTEAKAEKQQSEKLNTE